LYRVVTDPCEEESPVKIVSLDVHKDASLVTVVSEDGVVEREWKLPTDPAILRQVIQGVEGRKRAVFEEGPLSALLHDALKEVCDEVTSCDPTRNAMIARAEDSSDERDARRLATLTRADAIREVRVAPEPYRTLRSLTEYDERVQRGVTSVKNRILALGARQGLVRKARSLFARRKRAAVLDEIKNAGVRWQMESLCRRLDALREERVSGWRVARQLTRKLKEVDQIDTIPGVGALVSRTMVAWIFDPGRFKSMNALNSYGGLGLGQGITSWKPIGPTKASKRGCRPLKRVLMIAATAAAQSDSALGRKYQAHLAAGWDARAARRDLARTILFIACALWRKGQRYDDRRVEKRVTASGPLRMRP
jgi:hypothetical protein